MNEILEVVFTNVDGEVTRSRLFESIRAARNWMKWLSKQRFVKSVQLYRGGAGGELLEKETITLKTEVL
tara:strand:- start:270 stop:476 length:207 start_codon:yes stop_codon:yes gene_type:complete